MPWSGKQVKRANGLQRLRNHWRSNSSSEMDFTDLALGVARRASSSKPLRSCTGLAWEPELRNTAVGMEPLGRFDGLTLNATGEPYPFLLRVLNSIHWEGA